MARKPRSTFRRLFLATSILLVLLGIILPGAGMLYERSAVQEAASTYPAPGRMVDAGGFDLHLHCEGEGEPTIILDHISGGSSADWAHVRSGLADVTRVCAYDRAGHGWSEMSSGPRSASVMAAELDSLLSNADIAGPYILAGHGLGGSVQRAFAARNTEAVEGMVLIDTFHEDALHALPAAFWDFAEQERRRIAQMRMAGRIGLLRVMAEYQPQQFDRLLDGPLQNLPEAIQGAYRAQKAGSRVWTAHLEELASLDATFADLRDGTPLPSIPLLVLLTGDSVATHSPYVYPDGFPMMETARAWQELHLKLAEQSPKGVFILVRNTGHHIPAQHPDTVVSMIEKVYQELQEAPKVQGGEPSLADEE